MRQPWIRAGLCLMLAMAVNAGAFYYSYRLDCQPTADTESYRIGHLPLDAALVCNNRTLGYPILLEGVKAICSSYDDVLSLPKYLQVNPDSVMPFVHLGLYFLAVWGFYGGMRLLDFSRWLALAVCLGLLYSPLAYNWSRAIVPEVPAAAAAMFALGMLLCTCGNPRGIWSWFGLAFGVFVAYQMRPAYLFLVVLVPLLGYLLRKQVANRRGHLARGVVLTLGLVAATAVPYLGFCFFRLWRVGQFNLVSFGGASLIGVTGQFLTESMVPELPEHLQPLAQMVLQKRKRDLRWQTTHVSDDEFDFARAEQLYDPTLWMHYFPSATEVWPRQPFSEHNARLLEMSTALLRLRPGFYAKWVVYGYWAGLARLLELRFMQLPLLLALSTLSLWGIADWRWGSVASDDSQAWYALRTLGLLASAFALCKLLQVVLVISPVDRYLDAIYVFVPIFPAIFIYGIAETVMVRRNLEIAGECTQKAMV